LGIFINAGHGPARVHFLSERNLRIKQVVYRYNEILVRKGRTSMLPAR